MCALVSTVWGGYMYVIWSTELFWDSEEGEVIGLLPSLERALKQSDLREF